MSGEAGPQPLAMTLGDDLRAKIEAAGGNAACLHCQLSAVIDGHMQATWGGKVHAAQVAASLAEIIGDLLTPAPRAALVPLIGQIVGLIGNRVGASISSAVSFAEVTPAVVPADKPRLH